ncbi:MAG TPA: hypothetical protein VHC49_03755 [Mycobacteriales bacterium]|nr:hypothetical protein [Mycobacteriales bacterium]
MIHAPRRIRLLLRRDDGNAMIEFIFLGIILLIPLIYLVLAVSYVQRNIYGVTQAAREVGRAYAQSGNQRAAEYAARLAMQDQGGSDGGLVISWTGPGGSCSPVARPLPPLSAGEVFTVCVRRNITIPGVPSFVGARNNSVTGKFVVHVDDYADVSG